MNERPYYLCLVVCNTINEFKFPDEVHNILFRQLIILDNNRLTYNIYFTKNQ